MVNKEVVTGKTPNGGVMSEAYYFDSDGNSADKSIASVIKIRELDERGKLVFETTMSK